jgi:HEAT repeat protein
MSLDKHLDEIFDAERALRVAEDKLLAGKQADVAKLLGKAVDEAKKLKDGDEAGLRLVRLADLCAQVQGPEMADALIRILDDEEPGVRGAAADALLDLAYDRYAEVAHAIDRALDAKLEGPALCELPFLIAEVGEPSALLLLRRFLAHGDADVVAAAIEACVALGDPAAIPHIQKFATDTRIVSSGEDEDVATEAELGELASEAIASLESIASSTEG